MNPAAIPTSAPRAVGATGAAEPLSDRPTPAPRLARRLPSYAGWQEAYHRAFGSELKHALSAVFAPGARRVLDVACGSGCYAAWLSELLGKEAEIVALDANLSLLKKTRGTAIRNRETSRISPVASDALRLPFQSDSFDAVWCAQSLYSLPDPGLALAEMRRVAHPGGTVAVLENDTLHEVLLPWSPALELAVRQAELAAFREEANEKYYIGRSLARCFHSTGFRSWSLKTYAISRVGPAEPDVQMFLEGYLADLRRRVETRLSKSRLAAFDRYLTPGGASYLLDRTDFALTCLNYVAWGVK